MYIIIMDNKLNKIVNKITSNLKKLSTNQNKLMKLLLKFTFICLSIILGYQEYSQLDLFYSRISKDLPKDLPKKTILQQLKNISKIVLTNHKLDGLSLIFIIYNLLNRILYIYNITFNEKLSLKQLQDINITSIMDGLLALATYSVLKKTTRNRV